MTDKVQLTQAIRQSMDLLTHRAFREQGHFVKSTGLSMAQYGILMQLHYQHDCGISDISSRMEISSAAARNGLTRLALRLRRKVRVVASTISWQGKGEKYNRKSAQYRVQQLSWLSRRCPYCSAPRQML
jgi:hypothetical protein